MRIRVVKHYDEFLQIRSEWNDLLKRSLHPMVFLTHQWIDTWWKAFGEGKQLFILLVYDQDELIAIAPFMISHGPHTLIGKTSTAVNVKKIEFIANVHSNRADLILSRKPQETCNAIIDFLSNEQKSDWDLVSLEYFCLESPTAKYMKSSLCKHAVRYKEIPQMSSPYVSLNRRWDEYFKNLKPRFKKNLIYTLKRFEKTGNTNLIAYQGTEKLAGVLEKIFNVASKSWKAKEGTAISSSPQLRKFYTDLAYTAAQEDWLELFILYRDDTPLAFQYCLKFGGKFLLLKTEFDEDYRAFGVGNTIQWKVLESIFESGFTEFDLLGSSEPWKKAWSNEREREHITLYAFNKNFTGRCLRFTYCIKDVLKKILVRSDTRASNAT